MGIALLVVAAAAAIWWLTAHKGWGTGQKVIFWAVVVAALWILVAVYGVPQPVG